VSKSKQKHWDSTKNHDWIARTGQFELFCWQRSRRSWGWEVRWIKNAREYCVLTRGNKQTSSDAMDAANGAFVDICDGALQFIPINPLSS